MKALHVVSVLMSCTERIGEGLRCGDRKKERKFAILKTEGQGSELVLP